MKNSKIKNFIEKLQNLPEKQKKVVLWTIVAVLGLVMGIFWVRSAMNKLSDLGNELGKIEFPQIENPEIKTPVDETADWKTYKNGEYWFEIKYPEDFKISTELTKDHLVFLIFEKFVKKELLGEIRDYLESRISLTVRETPDELLSNNQIIRKELESFLLKDVISPYSGFSLSWHGDSFDNVFEKRKIGDNVFYLVVIDKHEDLQLQYYLVNERHIFNFTLFSMDLLNRHPELGDKIEWGKLDVEGDEYHIYLKQMLSTFKFVK